MADVKISQLPAATTPLGGTEQIPLVQGTTTKKVTVTGLFTQANLGIPSAVDLTNATNVPVDQATGTLAVNHGGTGTTTPSIVAGTNVTVSGTWPNQTINATSSGSVTGVTATAPVVSSGGTAPVISMAAATTSVNGYLTSTDWNTFNNKLATNGSAASLTGLPLTTGVTGLLPVLNGGTGTASPSLVQGTNVTITGTWPNQTINASGGSGGGDVSGPGSSTDNAVARFDSTTGKIIQNSGVVINDSGEVTVGVWKGTEIGLSYGGTGAASASQARGNILPSYAGNAGKVLAVNTGATDVEYISAGGTGTVTSVQVSGGTTGLTASGGPITAAGTITLAGTLAVANGGTGTATPSLVQGTNVTITGTWPNQTINSSGGGSMTYPGAGIANSTGTAWDTSYSTSGTGTVVALATSAALTTPAITGGTINNATIGATTPTTAVFTSLTVNDNSTFGSSNTDTVNFVGRVNSDFDPATDNAYDLGRTGHEWRNLYLTGTGNIDSLIADTADINGGTIDATTIGATTAAAITGTTVTATTKVVTPYVDAVGSAGGQLRNASGTSQLAWGAGGGSNLSLEVATNINPANAAVAISPTGTGTVTINPATAGTMNNMAIGGTTPAAGAFTTLTATTAIPVTSGGTGQSSALTQYGIVFASTTGAMATTAAGTAGYVLTSNGTSAPTFQAASGGLSRAQTTAISLVFGF